jgi:diacylglycerol kinase (ATP)
MTPRPRPDRVTGIAHFFAAARYSLAGVIRLWQETAFRHEALAGVAILLVLWLTGATALQLTIAFVLILVTIAVEALNTAIEVVVDHISPNWSEAARDAKDLGSLAVLCLLIANGVFATVAIYTNLTA